MRPIGGLMTGSNRLTLRAFVLALSATAPLRAQSTAPAPHVALFT